jgi:hypothetical protein
MGSLSFGVKLHDPQLWPTKLLNQNGNLAYNWGHSGSDHPVALIDAIPGFLRKSVDLSELARVPSEHDYSSDSQ